MGRDYGAIVTSESPTTNAAAPATAAAISSAIEAGINDVRTIMSETRGLMVQKGPIPPEHGSPFGRGSRRTDNGRWVTVLLVLNYMIGSGILNTAQTFRDSGVAACSVVYVIACEQHHHQRQQH